MVSFAFRRCTRLSALRALAVSLTVNFTEPLTSLGAALPMITAPSALRSSLSLRAVALSTDRVSFAVPASLLASVSDTPLAMLADPAFAVVFGGVVSAAAGGVTDAIGVVVGVAVAVGCAGGAT